MSRLFEMAENDPENIHETVLLKETADLLDVKNDGTYVDATLGLGGHSREILKRAGKTRVVGIDQDASALLLAGQSLSEFGERITLIDANFVGINKVLADLDIDFASGIVADLGMSDFDMGAILDNLDLSSVDMLIEIADKIKLNPQFRKAAEAAVGE